jgi:small subunit ribosomal protein S4e
MSSSCYHPQVISFLLRHHLKLCLTAREANIIVQDKEAGIRIDNKVRRSIKFPVGIMDTISVAKTNEHYRVLYDVKGRFTLVKVKDAEAKLKLLKVSKKGVGANKIPYIVTSDARTIRFPHPEIN